MPNAFSNYEGQNTKKFFIIIQKFSFNLSEIFLLRHCNNCFSVLSKPVVIVIVVVSNGIHYRSDTNRTGAKGLSFYYPKLLYCLDQMLAVMLLNQHRVSSYKTVRPRAPCGARCIGHAVRTWSAVCSEAPHSQFGEGARPHLCMDEWNHPTPVHRRLSLIQAA